MLDLCARPIRRALSRCSTARRRRARHYYWKSVELDELTEAAVAAIVDHVERIHLAALVRGRRSSSAARCPRVGEMDTAYAGRSPAFDVNINGVWLPEEPEGPPPTTWRGCGACSTRSSRMRAAAST